MIRRILHAANAIVFGHSIARVGSLILVPLFLRYWSAGLYGEYVALFAAVGYLSSLDIGMQQAVVNRLTQAYARKNLEEYRCVQHTALAFYVVLAVAGTLPVAANALFVLFDIRRRFPRLFPGFAAARFSVLKELTHPSILFCLLLIGNLIAFQGSIVLVSAVMGGLAVAVLSISKTVIDVIRQALYSISLALCPDLARMEALGEFEKLRKIHRMMVAGTAAITLALVASLWYEGPQIINMWTRGRIETDAMLLRLFLVFVAFQTPWAASSTIAVATNKHKVQAVSYFFAAICGIGLVAMLLRPLGLWAVPVGLTLGEAFGCYHFVIKASCNIIGESYSAFARRFW